ncbi:VacJ family lipoprotein [Geotalea daltonii FRC-32]|uniref:VacJ family lipoprotein n=1 Tax=Geotalea daltonii (strain DSM 22248 / JCM 15807 / FRC-32) TaxID=316067 RepID=B9M3R7_GEODF|nr:VacJ family lipoprotein [Geotalea daltonii]ACM19560.1 VacJ family lipoprotein [Geotalea daltonii FRC-32]
MTGRALATIGRILLAIVLMAVVCGCAAPRLEAEIPARHTLDEFIETERQDDPLDIYDPVERFNRGVYRFNYYADNYVFLPVVNFYEFVTPVFLQDRVSNFFNNVSELSTLANCILQLKPKCTAKTVGRIVINTTLGIGGMFDPATQWQIDRQREDFGQTLGYYGAGPGPFVVLPFMGPSNLRDTIGLSADIGGFFFIDPFDFEHNKALGLAFDTMYLVDMRHKIKFRYFESGSPFEYELIRMLYTKARESEIRN